MARNKNLPKQDQQPPVAAVADTDAQFTYNGDKYQVVEHAAIIPGLGKRTALEICNDADAQRYLVEEAKGTTVIKKIA